METNKLQMGFIKIHLLPWVSLTIAHMPCETAQCLHKTRHLDGHLQQTSNHSAHRGIQDGALFHLMCTN
jgi:hypothetical protein